MTVTVTLRAVRRTPRGAPDGACQALDARAEIQGVGVVAQSSATGRHWVWVVGPHCYLDEDGSDHPKLAPGGERMRWACHRDTRTGDLAVLYRSKQAKDIAYLFRATSDAVHEDVDERPWNCEVEVLERFDRPVPLRELRADPVTSTWSALRSSFVRASAPVPDDVWARLMEMVGREPGTAVATAAGPQLAVATVPEVRGPRPVRVTSAVAEPAEPPSTPSAGAVAATAAQTAATASVATPDAARPDLSGALADPPAPALVPDVPRADPTPTRGGTGATTSAGSPTRRPLVDLAVGRREATVRAQVERLRARHPEASTDELYELLEQRYAATLTGSGAAVGAAAAAAVFGARSVAGTRSGVLARVVPVGLGAGLGAAGGKAAARSLARSVRRVLVGASGT